MRILRASFCSLSLSTSSGEWVPGEQLILLLKTEAKKTFSTSAFSSSHVTVFPPTSNKGWRFSISRIRCSVSKSGSNMQCFLLIPFDQTKKLKQKHLKKKLRVALGVCGGFLCMWWVFLLAVFLTCYLGICHYRWSCDQ